MKKADPSTAQRHILREGEPVLIVDVRGKEHVLHLRSGLKTHHGRAGVIFHDWLIGKPPGVRITTDKGDQFVCVRPNLDDYILKRLRRHTQIIYPKDLGTLLVEGNIFPGARVLEAGLGSGAAALTFLRFLGSSGRLYSYEMRDEFVEKSRETIQEFEELYGTFSTPHEIRIHDIYTGIEEKDLDSILLDIPEPHRVLDSAATSLRPNGVLLSWLPTALQVYELVGDLKKSPFWAQIKTTESLVRPWYVGAKSIRPEQQMVGHTGFLTTARHVDCFDCEEP